MRKIFACAAIAAGLLVSTSLSAQKYLDPSLSPEERAEDLIQLLTLEEKSQILWSNSPAIKRLGIPFYTWWNECLHGIQGLGTVFPTPVGMAASFDDELVEEVFKAVSDEARARYNEFESELDPWESHPFHSGISFFTPNINIIRDPRWGRGMESYGEDPYLVGKMGVAVVNGLQGRPEDAEGYMKAMACAKHFAVHSGPEAKRHTFDSNVSERDLRETYLPAFKDLVQKAKVGSVMYAYNSFRGVPCGANTYLLTDILRNEWGYDGIILSDCAAVEDVWMHHKYVSTPEEACAAVIKAGADLECGWTYGKLVDAVRQGIISEDDLTASVLKVLAARFRLGTLEPVESRPYTEYGEEQICSEAHASKALQIARESIVLLQNKGNILPLDKEATIALVGPNGADSTMMWGNYSGHPHKTVTILDGLRERYPDVRYIRGCELAADIWTPERAEALLSEIDGIETIIFAGGLNSHLEGEELSIDIEGFMGGDRVTIELPNVQRELLRTLHEAGKKVIFLNLSGSAIGLVPETETCDAILQVWYPGQEGGTAVAEILAGEVNPSGKLPVTFYRSTDQLPDFEDYSMKGRTYRFFDGEPLFPFGFGLSYTDFVYKNVRYHNIFGKKFITLRLNNTGSYDGVEVVRMFVSRPDDAEGPLKTLRAFKRVEVKAGKSVKVRIPIDDETFVWWDEEKRDMRPLEGNYSVRIAGANKVLAISYGKTGRQSRVS